MKLLKKIPILLLLFFLVGKIGHSEQPHKPKIVIGLMVDQMRWDYLYKFQDRYGEGGFKRLMKEGFSCDNTFIRHFPTVTACGHSSVWTGSVPAINGIAGNSWYDRSYKKEISNVLDTSVRLVGRESGEGRSPRNLLTTTVGDELRMATNFQSKVVGVAIKDRGAILPAGHTANGAFWYSDGGFITSTYYMNQLPQWVMDFNRKNWNNLLMPDGWQTMYPITTYRLSDADNKDYEGVLSGENAPIFPHMTSDITSTPFGNELTLRFAEAAIDGYSLGQGNFTDLLSISLSSPDRIGHKFGITSIEVEDNYLRLDKQLEDFFNYLDKKFGKENYLFFLTADHGGNQSPGFLEEHQLPTGVIDVKKMNSGLLVALNGKFGSTKIFSGINESGLYLNYEELKKRNLKKKEVIDFVIDFLKDQPGLKYALDADELATAVIPERIKNMLINGHHEKRSSDIVLVMDAGWKEESRMGSTHGNWNPYDAHIPLVWMGWNIPKGKSHRDIGMTDIAPTIAALLDIQMPSGSIGKVITEITDR